MTIKIIHHSNLLPIAVLSLLLGCATCSVGAQSLPERIDSYLAEQMSANGIPGLSVAAVRDGKVVYRGAHGVSKLGTDDKLTAKDVFPYSSISKPFVATAIVQLIEKGKMHLDDPVTTYLPYFRLADEHYKDITIRQMLNHTSGMPNPVKDWTKEYEHPEFDEGAAERYVRSVASEHLLWDPGTAYRYSNLAFDTLGNVIAKVSGMPFEEYEKKNIFEPLGMSGSTFIFSEVDEAFRVTGHVGDSAQPSPVYPYDRRHAPCTTFNASADDMSRWLIANLNRGELDGHRILKPESYDLLWKPSTKVDIQAGFNKFQREHFLRFAPVTHGLGWYLGEIDGHRIAFHAGEDPGFSSFMILLPDDKIGVSVAINSNQMDVSALATTLVGLVLESENR